MGKTVLTIKGQEFYINDKLVYDEIEGHDHSKGLLMNARFIQGIFDNRTDRTRFHRFNKIFDVDINTQDFIDALPQWYQYGLRVVTVGVQGGMPVFTIDVNTIDNNPFGTKGLSFDEAYANRLDRIIRAADEIGMVVIVNILYWAQSLRFESEEAILSALQCFSSWIKKKNYSNVMIDLANEYNIETWKPLPIIQNPKNMAKLLRLVKEESGGLLVGSSGGGGLIDQEVVDASDVVLIHGNGLTRGEYYDFVLQVKNMAPNKPILCNEDSPCISRMDIAFLTHTSWGYYNNFTKQEPPCDWSITPGQDFYFARRMANALGLKVDELSKEDQCYLQGLEPNTEWEGKRWIHLSSEYPETINYVDFYINGRFVYRSYDEPHFLYRETTWIQKPWIMDQGQNDVKVVVTFVDGTSLTKSLSIK